MLGTNHNHLLSQTLIAFIAVTLAICGKAQAQVDKPPQVSIAPAILEIPAGKTAEVAVQVSGVQELYGFDVALEFDPNVVEIVAADTATAQAPIAISTFLDPGFVVLNQANNISGTARFAMTQLRPSVPKSGDGILIVMKLRGKSVGATSPITLTNIDMAHANGVVFKGALTSGKVQVVDASKVVANLSFPKQGAGTPMPGPTELAAVIKPKLQTAAPQAQPSSTVTPTVAAGNSGSGSGLVISPAVIGAVGGAAGVGVILLGFTAVQNRRRKTEDNRKP